MPKKSLSDKRKTVHRDRAGKKNSCYRHGHCANGDWTSEYRTWVAMMTRCRNPNASDWKYYGGRGIVVCDRWLAFPNFFEDMGSKPTPQHTLDRIDHEGAYCKENCRWASRKEQAQNRSMNLYYEFQGETLCLAEIARRVGINYNTLRGRILKGEPIGEAAVKTKRKPGPKIKE